MEANALMTPASARDQILARIRAANALAASSAAAFAAADIDAAYRAIPRDYLAAHHSQDIVALFAERTADYRAIVERVPASDVAAAVARALPGDGRYVVPDGFPAQWRPAAGVGSAGVGSAGVGIAGDDPPLSPAALDAMTGVITGCAVAIAETGTIILDHGPGQGRRALTLVPDFHLVIVRADQVEPDLAGAFGRLDPARPHTLISGPSATSDIELIRVEGVHGPRTLHVLLVG
ncbi:MAG TPA: LUD domain-containing protein [Streptosporangiaceae bacterium]